MNRNELIDRVLLTAMIISLIVFLLVLRFPVFYMPAIFLLPLHFPLFRKPSSIRVMAVFYFGFFPYFISAFVYFALLDIFSFLTINDYFGLAILALLNFVCIIIIYLYLEWDFRGLFPTKDENVKSQYGDFLEKIRISVDITRFIAGIPLSLIILFARKVTENDVLSFFNIIGIEFSKLGVTANKVVEILPFLTNSLLLPTVLGATVIKIYADYAKYKKRPIALDNYDLEDDK
ncbi:hypothetical protein EXW57_06645 [Bacillus mycoides]|uniref:hypothetical protein n=1 Tax=Bacillus mycoides TaxID=1405 RepID=UPI001C012A48|nr:hypothetical protein [Bacillus mycoides]QWI59478.1 hypothetical protein EXW57_06645 [Bacillus mycoides]